jgi:hypothetical protein
MGQGFRLEIHASPIFVPLTFASGYLFSVALTIEYYEIQCAEQQGFSPTQRHALHLF